MMIETGRQRINAQFSQILRFGIVGVGATLTHMAAALVFLQFLNMAPLIANLCAFLIAFSVSFTGHYYWTFSKPGHQHRAVIKFFAVASTGFFINTVILAALLADGRISEPLCLIIAIMIIPIATYFLSRIWAFKAEE